MAKILIVDDIQSNIQVLNEVLDKEFDVYFALNGIDALKAAESLRPDLILLDSMIPDLNGFECCRILKEHESFKNIPVIVVTAQDSCEDESMGLEAGADDIITEPFNPAVVLSRVRTHIKLKTQADQLLTAYENTVQKNMQLIDIQEDLSKKMAELEQYRTHLEELVDTRPIDSKRITDEADQRNKRQTS